MHKWTAKLDTPSNPTAAGIKVQFSWDTSRNLSNLQKSSSQWLSCGKVQASMHRGAKRETLCCFSTHSFTQTVPFSSVLFRFCWAVDYLLPTTECKLNIWTTEAASENRGERERAMTESRTPPFWMYYNFGTQSEFVPAWLAPGLFFPSSAHIYTLLSPQNPAWMTATFSGPQKLLLEQRKEEKKVKETTSNLLTMTNPAELLKGIRMSKVQQEQNFEKKK